LDFILDPFPFRYFTISPFVVFRMIRVGICSWTEKTLVQSGQFYPPNVTSAEGRLRYYASHFDTVEVDSVYYAIPDQKTAWLWDVRTPSGFIFHIKAYGALTGHGIDLKTLPRDLQTHSAKGFPEKRSVYVKDETLLGLMALRLRDSLEPLRRSGKLGLMVFQYPPWFTYGTRNMGYILKCKEWMDGLSLAVEFRHGSWLTPGRQTEILKFLDDNRVHYVSADEPQYGNLSTVPFVPGVTGKTAYFRLHGRNTDNWLKKGIETSLRYAYSYSDEELERFIPSIEETEAKSETIYVMLNNCHRSFAVENAARIKEFLKAHASRPVLNLP
jgi:uncharacterized protein YecE (DUF72 family)